MRKYPALSAVILLLCLAAYGADDECAVKLTGWKLNRIRKDKSGANRVIATFNVKNTSGKPLRDFRSRMVFYEAMGKKLRATRWKPIKKLDAGNEASVSRILLR